MTPLTRTALAGVRQRRHETPPQHIARLRATASSHVMGRDAVTVVMVCYLAPAAIQLTPGLAATASRAVDVAVGSSIVAYVWAGLTLLAVGLHVAALRKARVPDQYVPRRLVETAALVLMALMSAVFVLSILDAAGAVDTSWAVATSLALIINSVGRAWLLVTQVRSFRWLRRRGYLRRGVPTGAEG